MKLTSSVTTAATPTMSRSALTCTSPKQRPPRWSQTVLSEPPFCPLHGSAAERGPGQDLWYNDFCVFGVAAMSRGSLPGLFWW